MSTARGVFVTGTDTEIGKTVISLGLMQHLQDQGLTVAGMKPVASGCVQSPDGLRNDDAVSLQQQSSIPLAYEAVNPYAYEPAIAPHLAAEYVGETIDIDKIYEIYQILAKDVDVVVVEGVGGWRAPLTDHAEVADLACRLGLPVCMVVGMKLGCLNHALLTAAAIEARGCELAGWVANHISPAMESVADNINTLKHKISSPQIGMVPMLTEINVKTVAQCLDYTFVG